MKEYIETKEQNIVKSLNSKFPQLSFGVVNKLFRKKDIKINDKRISSNVKVYPGDKISVYFDFDSLQKPINIVYEDDKVAIINKSVGIEVVGEDSLSQKLGEGYIAVHRLDLNTEGLIIFAKSPAVESLLREGFANKKINKQYTAWIKGSLYKDSIAFSGYLFKDAKKSRVYIYDTKKPNTKEIVTNIFKDQGFNTTSLVKVEIPTGRTHQIRATLSYLNMPIIGDEKYGDNDLNKKLKLKRQCLTATKLSFCFEKSNPLSYLNEKTFEVSPSWLDKVDKKL